MPKRIKPTEIGSKSNLIKPTHIDLNQRLSFSFKYLEKKDNFDYSCRETNYFCKVIERFKDLCNNEPLSLKESRSSSLRCHPIRWEETSEDSFGIPNEEEIVDAPYQFEISAKRHGRIHGFFIDSVFYIRWLDPDHNLY